MEKELDEYIKEKKILFAEEKEKEENNWRRKILPQCDRQTNEQGKIGLLSQWVMEG